MKKSIIASFLLISISSIPMASAGAFGFMPYGNSDSESYFVEVSAYPGATVKTNFILRNDSDSDMTYSLNLVDSTKTDTGDFALKADTEPKTEVGLWSTISTPTVSIDSGNYKILEASITVPETQALGEYLGGVTGIEVANDENVSSEGAAGIVSIARNTIRVRVTVVAKENYVEPTPFQEPDNSQNEFKKYIIPAIFIFSAVFLLVANRLKAGNGQMKKKSGKKTKK